MPYDGGNYQDTVARKMLRVLGENGEHWIQGKLEDDCGGKCLLGALIAAKEGSNFSECAGLLSSAVSRVSGKKPPKGSYGIAGFNNGKATTFDDIKLALEFYHEAELAGECVS